MLWTKTKWRLAVFPWCFLTLQRSVLSDGSVWWELDTLLLIGLYQELHSFNCILILPPNTKMHYLTKFHSYSKCTVFSWTNGELIFLFAFVFELKEAWFKPYWAIHELPSNLVNESTQRSQLLTTNMSTILASGSNNNHTGLCCL